MKVKTTLNIPDNLVKDLATGSVNIANAVVRSNKTWKIIKYVPLGPGDKLEEAKAVAKSIKGKNLIIGLGVTAAVVTVGGLITFIIKKTSKKSNVEVPKCITEFQKNFKKYLNEAQKGIVNVKTIDELLSTLNEIELLDDKEIKIDFSAKELKFLLKKIYEFTKNINIEQGNQKQTFKAPSSNSAKNIVYLKDYLQYQKQVAS